ncbi:MAG TPA: tetratricopeptide repeat protein [Candidatus Saccharimonadales bacterium]
MSNENDYKDQISSPELSKQSSPVRDVLKDIKNLPRKEATRLLGDAWKLVNLGVSNSKEWVAELYDQNAVFESNGGNLKEAERLSLAGLKLLEGEKDKHFLTRARLARNLSQTYITAGEYDAALRIADFALSEHELDQEKFQHVPEAHQKGVRHKLITQTYYDRALILSGSDDSDAAKDRILDFLSGYDSGTLSSEVARVVSFVEAHIDPSIRDQFPKSKERSPSLNPLKIGVAATRTAFHLADSGLQFAKKIIPKI